MTLIEAFDIRAGDLISIVGGGGKSSLLFGIERAWLGNVVVTMTTRIFAAQVTRARASLTLADVNQLGEKLATHRSCLVIGETEGDKAKGVSAEIPHQLLTRPDVDIVAVEADGSRMRPVKAPAAHEPVIASGTTLGIVVVGIDALEGSIDTVAHRPKRVANLTQLTPNDTLTAECLTTLLTDPRGGLKSMPDQARIAICINKVDSAERQRQATAVAKKLMETGKVERVVLTMFQPAFAVQALFR
ncbi:MAG: selenium cofactor biosynthesis protein YqeC [Candidatus Promineifilaceae bacterium]